MTMSSSLCQLFALGGEGTVKTWMSELIPLACFLLQWLLVLENPQTCSCTLSHNPGISLITHYLRKYTPYSSNVFVWLQPCTTQTGYVNASTEHGVIRADLGWSGSYRRPLHGLYVQLDGSLGQKPHHLCISRLSEEKLIEKREHLLFQCQGPPGSTMH